MGWLTDWLQDIEGQPAAPAPIAKPLPREHKPEIKPVFITTRRPRESDPGEAEQGFYSVEGGVVVMRDQAGKPTGKQRRLEPGDDAYMIAARMVRERWLASAGESNFNRRIDYPRIVVV